MAGISAIIPANRGKQSCNRALRVADGATRTANRIAASEWSLATVLEEEE